MGVEGAVAFSGASKGLGSGAYSSLVASCVMYRQTARGGGGGVYIWAWPIWRRLSNVHRSTHRLERNETGASVSTRK